MPASARDRGRRQHRRPEQDNRARRAAEAQQAAYEASRAVLTAVARERGAVWQQAAADNRRRARVPLVGLVVLGLVVMVLGLISLVFVIAGALLLLTVLVLAWGLWTGASGVLERRLGGITSSADRPPPGLEMIDAARLADLTEGLCAILGLDRVELRVLDDSAMNAISIARRGGGGVVLVTAGLVRGLDRIELEAVLAHEMSHLKRADGVPAAVAVVTLGPLAKWFPGARSLMRRTIGDDREPQADLAAVGATRYPPGLEAALGKISRAGSIRPAELDSSLAERTAGLWIAPLDELRAGPARTGALTLEERIEVLGEL